ncbi:hypothetical protein LEP1GSC166_3328 [Leptospira kirschneri]|nr:hypothetical protein LEP1GSC166_2569 [Leptospira kirschneri]EMK04190.1 hypothetical protein LEP1GSC166_3328 [Leptospira kirschneri]
MVAKTALYKNRMDDDSFLFYSSSHNFQSLTGKSMICESSHIYFFTKK